MQIIIPEDLGGKLRVLPEDTYQARIQDLFLGKSQAGNPKLTLKWVITSEYSGTQPEDYVSTVGEAVLENFSLLPQALWNLNDLYRDITGEQLPAGEMSDEEFLQMLKDALIGAEMSILVTTDDASGEPRSVVEDRKKLSDVPF